MKLDNINIHFLRTKDGIITKQNEIEKFDDHCHLCSFCANAYVGRCNKVTDYKKKEISAYPFIKYGYQQITDGEITKFVIIKCDNYKFETKEIQKARLEDEVKRLSLKL